MSPTCPPQPPNANTPGIAIIGTFTFQRVVQVIGWICLAATALLCIGLCVLHFRKYRAPNEQRNVIRIILFPVVASLVSVISIHTYQNSGYIEPIALLYETVALASLFMLYVQYVAPEPQTRVSFFKELEYKTKTGEMKPMKHYQLFRAAWIIVFTYIVVTLVLVIAEEITRATGVYCETSSKPAFAHFWIQLFTLVATVIAVVTVVRFQRRLKSHMTGRKAMPKLLCFKLFVLITTLQHFAFSIIASHVQGNDKITYNDIIIGLQSLLVCIEALFTQVAFFFFFHPREFGNRNQGGKLSGDEAAVPAVVGYTPTKAIIHSLNPMDLILGIGQAYGMVKF
ncbi:hypothetical protein H2204_002095 [Knufia peltigerae]|uniref:DUF300-domain-containing protein n=1 Tax=Knufia peltigerae TaxID=1002370 RepID=A0AA38YBM8_9EURO|nr:hypothetical protein H2204_002095 [Knufia peltigerae]